MGFEDIKGYSELDSLDLYSGVKLRGLNGKAYDNRLWNLGVENDKSVKAGTRKYRVGNEINCKDIDKKKEDRITVIKADELVNCGGDDKFASKSGRMTCVRVFKTHETGVSFLGRKVYKRLRERPSILGFNLADLLQKEGIVVEILNAMREDRRKSERSELELGDLVWGKVKSHPWWPGQIFNEAFASSSARQAKKKGYVLVAFFGDYTYKWFDPLKLIPFDTCYVEKSKQTKVKEFLAAVEEAVTEIKRRAALGLTCHCLNDSNFRPTHVQGFLEVEVSGYESGAVYSVEQIRRAREDFQASNILSFVKQLALTPAKVQKDIDWMKNIAKGLAYRKAVYAKSDSTYFEALLGQSKGSTEVFGIHQKALVQVVGSTLAAEAQDESSDFTKLIRADDSKNDKCPAELGDESNASGGCDFRMDSGDRSPQKIAPKDDWVPMFKEKKDYNDVLGGDITAPSSELAQVKVPLKQKRRRPESPQASKKKVNYGQREKMSGKRVRGKNNVKSLHAEKQHVNQKHLMVEVENAKGMEEHLIGSLNEPRAPMRSDEPMLLVLNFPREKSLPSVAELKVRFARFRSLDISSIFVYYKSSTCQVGFLNKDDAMEAYNAVKSGTVFSKKLRCHLQAVEAEASKSLDDVMKSTRSAAVVNPPVSANIENFTMAKDNNNYRRATSSSTNIKNFDFCMLNLLTRCDEVVGKVKKRLGYMPYHEL